MNEIFGISTTSIMLVLLIAFVLCLLSAGWVALRQRVVFRMGMRNVPRRPAQTALIVVGLMLSTLIIAAAFTTGDTLDSSIRGEVLDILGETDELVVLQTGETGALTRGGAVMPEQVVAQLEAGIAGNPAIDGVLPLLFESVPAVNARSGLSEPSLALTGLDPARLAPFGGIRDTEGRPLDLTTLAQDEVVLAARAADELDARVGDTLVVYIRNQPVELRVAAIGADSILTGYHSVGTAGGFVMPLERAQRLLGYPLQISSIAVTNAGDVTGGLARTDAAVAALDDALEGSSWAAVPVKQDDVDQAELAGNAFLTLFIVFGLFSISVGVLLIFLIFVMLAAERKPEMGMARAVGMRRRQLTQMYLAEGVAYDLVAALVGAALGVVAAWVMAGFMGRLIGEFFTIRPSVSWRSLVISYTLGVAVTFVTILVSSWRVSRLNITQAIRDIPEPQLPRAGRRALVWGVLGLAASVPLIWGGLAADLAFPFSLGVSLAPICLAAILRRFGVPPRPLYSAASALVLLYWLTPSDWSDPIVGTLEGSVEMFFLSGIMLVAASTTLIVWNAPVFTTLVGLLGRAFSRWLPAVKTAVAYPLERKGRTGMTIAMFSLVIFSLVMMATINATANELVYGSEESTAGWDIQAVHSSLNPIDDFGATLAANGIDPAELAATGRLREIATSQSQLRLPGEQAWSSYPINGADDAFLTGSLLPLQTRAVGYASDAAVWEALRTTPGLAVIDNNAIPSSTTITIGGGDFRLEGVESGDTTMEPLVVEVGEPLTGRVREVTIVGVIDTAVVTLPGLTMADATYDRVFSDPGSTNAVVHVARVQPGVDAERMAKRVEAALLSYGVQADAYATLIEESSRVSRGFLTLVEGFMLLGLVVGVAALGVIAFRSVVERRQQIGMLRAIGYQRSMVAASFLIESTLITLLGTLSGAILGLLLAWQLVASEYFFGSSEGAALVVPWGEIGLFVLIALVAALLMAWLPAQRASRVPIAEALRYE